MIYKLNKSFILLTLKKNIQIQTKLKPYQINWSKGFD
jgi:hypothetical protein